jgi:hypothetical protein
MRQGSMNSRGWQIRGILSGEPVLALQPTRNLCAGRGASRQRAPGRRRRDGEEGKEQGRQRADKVGLGAVDERTYVHARREQKTNPMNLASHRSQVRRGVCLQANVPQ